MCVPVNLSTSGATVEVGLNRYVLRNSDHAASLQESRGSNTDELILRLLP